MHTCQILAFIILAVAAGLAAFGKAWPLALVAAALAVELIPAVFPSV